MKLLTYAMVWLALVVGASCSASPTLLPTVWYATVGKEIAIGAGAAAAAKAVEWTLDSAKEYWAAPNIVPYVAIYEIVTDEADTRQGFRVDTTRIMRLNSLMGLGPKSSCSYLCQTRRTMTVAPGNIKIDADTTPFQWDSLERRNYYEQRGSSWPVPGGYERKDLPSPSSGDIYRWFKMRFKLVGYCSASGITKSNFFDTGLLVGRTTRRAYGEFCQPYRESPWVEKTEFIVRSVAIPLSGFVFFEWDSSGNYLYERPKFLKEKPSPGMESVTTLPDPRTVSPVPITTPAPGPTGPISE